MTLFNQVLQALDINESSLNPGQLNAINSAINAMLAQLRGYTGRYLTQATWLDTYLYHNHRCRGRGSLVLSEYPVVSIASITSNPGLATEAVLDPTMYYVDKKTGELHTNYNGTTSYEWWRWGADYPGFAYSMAIQYTAGYDPLPDDLVMLISDFARDRYNSFKAASGSSDAIQGEVQAVQIEGVGRVQYRSGVSRMVGGFDNKSAASGGPILGAGAMVADLYRDVQKFVYPDTHVTVESLS